MNAENSDNTSAEPGHVVPTDASPPQVHRTVEAGIGRPAEVGADRLGPTLQATSTGKSTGTGRSEIEIFSAIERLIDGSLRIDQFRLRQQLKHLRARTALASNAADSGPAPGGPSDVQYLLQNIDWNLLQAAQEPSWDQLLELLRLLPNEGRAPKTTGGLNEGRRPTKTKNQNTVRAESADSQSGKISSTVDQERSNPWLRFAVRLKKSLAARVWRAQHLPKVAYAGDLPVHASVTEIRNAILENQVIVLCGETGSGKSTQLPKICLEAGLGVSGVIGHTQPRRIAARSVAARVAEELDTKLGEAVGFKIRFHDDTGEQTFVKLMTDGILLAETQSDRHLESYDAIILDEAHERSLNIDFLLGYLKQVCHRRPEFRLIITSATIDAQRFAAHFTDRAGQAAPIIEVQGRGFPVDIQYRSPEVEDGAWVNPDQSVIRAVESLAAQDRGHILIFLPTERDILSLSKKLRNLRFGNESVDSTEVIPLYARLSVADQQRIFKPTSQRRIVLATNVAESSLTVPGIKYVIDTGTARISRYSPRSKVQRLPIEAISQASANQRAGRCGRVGPGVCVRLYSQEDFEQRDPFTTPEIRRTNLASVILQAKMLNLGRLEDFPFIDPPRPEAISEGNRSLFEIGAINEQGDLTPLGRQLGKLPIDPRIGRMIIEAASQGCVHEVLIIAAAMEVQDPRVRPAELAAAADQAHQEFQDKRSDFLSYLKLWNFYHQEREKRSKSVLRKVLHAKFISPERIQQWLDVHRQLRQMTRELRLPHTQPNDTYANIHRSLLAGLLSGVAMLDEKEPKLKRYQGAANVRFQLWPGSGLDRLPKWIMVGEIIETSRNFGRTVASMESSWIEPLAGHLIKRKYSQPRWNSKTCGVTANERVTLFGLPIVEKRRVAYGRIDPQECRLLMFAEGFFLGQWEQPAPEFLQKNWALQQELQDLGQKSRRLGWVIDEQRVVDFYADRLPEDVVDAATLNRFVKRSIPQVLSQLEMQAADLIRENLDYRPEDFPNVLDVGTARLPLLYQFTPSDSRDGVFLQVPLEVLGQITDQRLAWVVPGWIEAKVVQMIRSLPKAIRRNLVPAPDTARQVAAELNFATGSFYHQVAERLSAIAEQPIDTQMFEIDKIDPHLTMGIQVVDDAGKVLAQGRRISEIRQQLSDAGIDAGSQIIDERWERSRQSDWTFGSLPLNVEIRRGEILVDAFPAVIDQNDSVGVALFDNAGTAYLQHLQGLVRLFTLVNRKNLKSQLRWLPDIEKTRLLMSRWISTADLNEDLLALLVRVALVDEVSPLRTEAEFRQVQHQAVGRIGQATIEVAKWLPNLAEAVHRVDNRLAEVKTQIRLIKPFNDARGQVRGLLAPGFLRNTPWQWLQHYPRYLAAVEYRLSRLTAASAQLDLEKMDLVALHWDKYQTHRQKLEVQKQVDPELNLFRWMIEEYRVSVFAQPLGTEIKISPQRLEKQWQQVRPLM